MRWATAGWVALAAGAAAPEVPAACDVGEPPGTASGNVQYLADRGELLAWREWTDDGRLCVRLDWPQQKQLSAEEAAQLARRLAIADDRRAALILPALPRAEVERVRRVARPHWLPPEMVLAPVLQGPLPLCPRVPPLSMIQPLELPPSLAATVLRVRPHRCQPGSLPTAGSGVLLSPILGLTAAHVVMTPAGKVCSRYRVAPGGRRYNDPPAAPYGLSFVSRAALSGRGGWVDGASSAPPRTGDLDARTRHDHAWLLLDDAATLPADVAWPRLRFGAPPVPVGEPVLSAGYPAQTPTGRAAPGAMVSLWGQAACAQTGEQARRHALWTSLGGSGGPIWTWSAQRPWPRSKRGAPRFRRRPRFCAGRRWQRASPTGAVDVGRIRKRIRCSAMRGSRRAARVAPPGRNPAGSALQHRVSRGRAPWFPGYVAGSA